MSTLNLILLVVAVAGGIAVGIRMGSCFLLGTAARAAATVPYPLAEPVRPPVTERILLIKSRPARFCGLAVTGLILALHVLS